MREVADLLSMTPDNVHETGASLDGQSGSLKGAFIQIMPLTWDSFLPPVMDRHPWQTI
jgi:hypothetical protein